MNGRDHPGMVIPPEAFLEGYPEPMRRLAERLRALVRLAVPGAVEAVRPGWRLIGYEVPGPRRRHYFAYVAPEPLHVHLGFEHGVDMDDAEGLLQGAGITRQVRWLTWTNVDDVDDSIVLPLVREAARVALLGRAERVARRLDRDDRGGWIVPGTGPGAVPAEDPG